MACIFFFLFSTPTLGGEHLPLLISAFSENFPPSLLSTMGQTLPCQYGIEGIIWSNMPLLWNFSFYNLLIELFSNVSHGGWEGCEITSTACQWLEFWTLLFVFSANLFLPSKLANPVCREVIILCKCLRWQCSSEYIMQVALTRQTDP